MAPPRAYLNPVTGRIHYITDDGGPPNEGRPPRQGDHEPNARSPPPPAPSRQPSPPPQRRVHFNYGSPPVWRTPPPPYDLGRRATYPWQQGSSHQQQWHGTGNPPDQRRGGEQGAQYQYQHQNQSQNQNQNQQGQGRGNRHGQAVWTAWTDPRQAPRLRYLTRDGGPPNDGRPPPRGGDGRQR